jgi:Family of unknown function (DUF5701)
MTTDEIVAEFDRQVENLIEKGYPGLAGLRAAAFRRRLAPLRELASRLESQDRPPGSDRVPFVIVVGRELAPAERAIELVERRGRTAFSVLDPDELQRFVPIDGAASRGSTHLLIDIDTGADTRNVTPDEALTRIVARGRSPLTVEEGIALVTHYPEAVARTAGFSLPGSRCGDRRVTALWISEGRPKLGWCWAGNPHTWLGSASCADRVGP